MDSNWIDKWIRDEYNRITPGKEVPGTGDTGEPGFTRKVAPFLEAMGSRFKEGTIFIDYGCGGGQLANVLSGHLRDFAYYGLEPKGGKIIPSEGLSLGETMIKRATEAFGHDPRVHYGFIGDPIEERAISIANAIIVAGVFCHLNYDEFQWACDKFLPVINQGGILLFSLLMKETPHNLTKTPKMAGINLNTRFYTVKQLEDYAGDNNLVLSSHTGNKISQWEYFSYTRR